MSFAPKVKRSGNPRLNQVVAQAHHVEAATRIIGNRRTQAKPIRPLKMFRVATLALLELSTSQQRWEVRSDTPDYRFKVDHGLIES